MNRQNEFLVTPNTPTVEIDAPSKVTDEATKARQRLQQAARILATGAIRAALKKKQAATQASTPHV